MAVRIPSSNGLRPAVTKTAIMLRRRDLNLNLPLAEYLLASIIQRYAQLPNRMRG